MKYLSFLVILASVFLLGVGYFFASAEEIYFDQGYNAAKQKYLPLLQKANASIDQFAEQLMDCKAWEQRLTRERDDALSHLTKLEYAHTDLQDAYAEKSDSLSKALAAMILMKEDIISLLEQIEELKIWQENSRRANGELEQVNMQLNNELLKMKKACKIGQQVSGVIQSNGFYAISMILLMVISGLVWKVRRKTWNDYV